MESVHIPELFFVGGMARLGVGEIMNRLQLELFHLDSIESWSGPRSKFVTFGGGGRGGKEGRGLVGRATGY